MDKKTIFRNEICLGCKLTKHELVQDKYLRNERLYDSLGLIFQQEKLDKSNHKNMQKDI